MKRLILAAGVAALAISAPALSKPDNKGGENGRDRGAKVEKQRGNDRQAANKSNRKRAENRERRVENRAKQRQQARKADDRRIERREKQVERMADRREDRLERRADRRDGIRELRAREQQLERRAERRDQRLIRLAERGDIRPRDWDELARRGIWIDGCPPGLAKKPVACMPPGQAKGFVGEPLQALRQQVALRALPDKLRYVYQDTPDYYYRYGNGYAYRINRQNDVISALLPLFGLGLTTGQMFPTNYSNNYYMPIGLKSFYPDSPYTSYRYANGYVYQIDPVTGLIEDVDPMLGYGYGYGQMMPTTYSAYNVPFQYRPLYADTSDYYYRYAPGAIYQVDPQTSLITGIAALLTNGMTVGQPIPTGYGVYNVPYAYRSQYYDTSDAWYRYANGNIYRVDPTTQLVTALVASILT